MLYQAKEQKADGIDGKIGKHVDKSGKPQAPFPLVEPGQHHSGHYRLLDAENRRIGSSFDLEMVEARLDRVQASRK